MKQITKGNREAKILLVGEALGPEEVAAQKPFVGWSGQELDNMLFEAGILPGDCFYTNILHTVPPLGPPEDKPTIDACFFNAKEAKAAGTFNFHGRYPNSNIMSGILQLSELIEEMEPNLIIAMGNTPFWALTGNVGITNWRGSITNVQTLPSISRFKVIPTFNPAAVTRNWPWRWIMVQDLRRCREEAKFQEVRKPNYKFHIRPTFDKVFDFLNTYEGKVVAEDIETWSGKIDCIGIGVSNTEAMCIPITCYGKREGYWSAEEEVQIIMRLRQFMMNSKGLFANGVFDIQHIARQWGFLPNIYGDTQVAQHTCFPGISDDTRLRGKSLAFVASMYCEHYTYWKGESRSDTKDIDGEDQEWGYNCLMKGTGIITRQGTVLIEDIVKKKLEIEVKTINETTGKIEYKKVINWHKTRRQNQKWLKLQINGTNRKGIVCTPDHEILTVTGRKIADTIKIGDLVYINEEAWSEEYFSAICGTVLGDSFVSVTTSNKEKAVVTCRQKSEALILEKQRLFGGSLNKYYLKNKDWNVEGWFYDWTLPASLQGKLLRNLCYFKGKKFAEPLLQRLDTQGLALWYMDDGYIQKKKNNRQTVCCFAIQGFEDKYIIKQWIEEYIGKCHVDTDGQLRLSVKASKKLCELIGPYIIDEFRYKLPFPCNKFEKLCPPKNTEYHYGKVISIEVFDTSVMANRGYKNIRYCLSVQDNANFMTTGGLVSNCKDCCYTYEGYHALMNVVKQMNLEDQYQLIMDIHKPLLEMMLRGIRVDNKATNILDTELMMAMSERSAWFEEVLGHELKPGSNKQMVQLLYGDLDLKPNYKKGAKGPTCDDEALKKVIYRQPLMRPLVNRVIESRSLRVFRSNFVMATRDPDDRMRTSLNPANVETFRLGSSKTVFNTGCNMQTIPSGHELEDQ